MEKLGNETGGKWNEWKVKRVESETNTFKFKMYSAPSSQNNRLYRKTINRLFDKIKRRLFD